MADRITQIPAPRVPIVDPQTGLIHREWYRFFYNLYNIAGTGTSSISTVDLALAPVPQFTDGGGGTAPVVIEEVDIGPPFPPVPGEFEDKRPHPDLGTFAALQQANLPWTTFARNPNPYPSTVPGTVYWDNEERSKTLAVVMEDSGSIVQDIGEETFYRVKASATITKGQVVMLTGAVGASGGLEAAPATGLTAAQVENIMGVATQNIANNQWGYVTWFGEIANVNTTGGAEAWVDGEILYYNPAVVGGLTKIRPAPPNPIVIVAVVVNAASNGILFVRPTYFESGGAIINSPPVTKTANFSVSVTDSWIINNKSGSTCTVTLPSASTNVGRVLHFINHQPQNLVSASANVIPQGGGAAQTGILLNIAGNWATLSSDGTNWVIMQAGEYNNLLLES
jgi:hypothetical protein